LRGGRAAEKPGAPTKLESREFEAKNQLRGKGMMTGKADLLKSAGKAANPKGVPVGKGKTKGRAKEKKKKNTRSH